MAQILETIGKFPAQQIAPTMGITIRHVDGDLITVGEKCAGDNHGYNDSNLRI
jgi:hypothetical protein